MVKPLDGVVSYRLKMSAKRTSFASRQEEAMKVIDKAIASAGPTTYQLQLIHGYNRGTSFRSKIYDWYRYEPKVKRIIPGDNPGITVLVLKELY